MKPIIENTRTFTVFTDDNGNPLDAETVREFADPGTSDEEAVDSGSGRSPGGSSLRPGSRHLSKAEIDAYGEDVRKVTSAFERAFAEGDEQRLAEEWLARSVGEEAQERPGDEDPPAAACRALRNRRSVRGQAPHQSLLGEQIRRRTPVRRVLPHSPLDPSRHALQE